MAINIHGYFIVSLHRCPAVHISKREHPKQQDQMKVWLYMYLYIQIVYAGVNKGPLGQPLRKQRLQWLINLSSLDCSHGPYTLKIQSTKQTQHFMLSKWEKNTLRTQKSLNCWCQTFTPSYLYYNYKIWHLPSLKHEIKQPKPLRFHKNTLMKWNSS